MSLFGQNIVKLVSTKSNDNSIAAQQLKRGLRVKRNGKLIK